MAPVGLGPIVIPCFDYNLRFSPALRAGFAFFLEFEMPIYAYRCEDCGFEKDVLQKFSDAPLTDCPQCQKPAFNRMVTAPTFQLKGTGWYVTDFRGGNSGKGAASRDGDSGGAGSPGEATATTESSGADASKAS
jgi:putative FmdB family regulatory protein